MIISVCGREIMGRGHFKSDRIYKRRRIAVFLGFVVIVLLVAILTISSFIQNGIITPDQSPAPNENIPPEPLPTDIATEYGVLPVIGTVKKAGKMYTVQKKVGDFIATQHGKYGVHFIDLATDEYFGINDRDSYIAASTSKLPMNLMLYTKFEKGEINPEFNVQYLEEDLEPGTGIIQKEPFGTEFTIKEASELSIRYSDNCAINMIIRTLGIEEICQYILDLGGDIYYTDGNRTSPHDLGIIARELYRLYLINPDLYGELIYNLENTQWDDRIRAQLPKEVRVAHKIGNQVRTVNDVGIVFASHPFALAIMTEDVDAEVAKNNIAIISKMVYDEVESYAR
jgi:beta-lactamase class A